MFKKFLPVFDWGTYNALSTLSKAGLIGTRLTEIPPMPLVQNGIDYFLEYRETAQRLFNTITAHGPYYPLSAPVNEERERALEAHLKAISNALVAGAQVYGYHLGEYLCNDPEKDLELHALALEQVCKLYPTIIFAPETSYTPFEIGSIEEIGYMIDHVKAKGYENVAISAQLENIWMRETQVAEGKIDPEEADKKTNYDFWMDVLERVYELSEGFLVLKFSQCIPFKKGERIFKKRAPLGQGYPNLEPLAEALSDFFITTYKRGRLLSLFIYTGLPEVKYRDSITIYYEIMRRIAEKI
jgi:endonuclease IV